jgi:RNA polymerase sigma-54 factor
MAIAQRLEIRQGQGLVMTPQLQQAIKLLQMSNLELNAFVEQELERNPLLERDEAHDNETGEPAPTPTSDVETSLTLSEDAPPANAAEAVDTDYDNLYAEDSGADRMDIPAQPGLNDWSQTSKGARSFDEDIQSLEGSLSEEITLRGHLAQQLTHAFPEPSLRLIGSYLIDQIDESGYFSGSLPEAAEALGTDIASVEAVLLTIQKFDPTGAGARSLAECLALQLKERNRYDPAIAGVLDNLELLAKRDMAGLMRAARVSAEDLAGIIADIKTLNPKPGLKFGSTPVTPALPDVFVRDTGRGGFHVELNSDTLPRVLINQRYYTTVAKGARQKEAKAYLTECMNTANWLVKSLDQRAKTILKVSSEIVRQQDGFFAYGVSHLRPLNLRMIADAIGMHESTVSRVTNNKYMATPRGLFELKYFFTASIASAEGGEAHSAEAVRHQIRELIEKEDIAQVMSDDRIVDILREKGVEIARRTVAKYREAMRIPSSVERRRLGQGFGQIWEPQKSGAALAPHAE